MESDWLILRTRYRQELKVSAILQHRKFISYVPMRQEVRTWSDRKKKCSLPFFPGYIFFQQNQQDLHSLDYIPGSCGILARSGIPAKCTEKKISEIRNLESSRIDFKVQNSLQVGDRVKIIRGPLMGLEGHFVRTKSENRFILNAEALNQSISIEINIEDLCRL